MISPPKTLQEAEKTKYGNSFVRKYYISILCAYEVYTGAYSHQCKRKNGHGINNLYCKQHARIVGND